MQLQDLRGQQTIEQLKRAYNLDAIAKTQKAVELQKETITKVENEQTNIINSLMLSLDGIESQSAMSLWFFNSIPTLENKPVSDWTTDEIKTEHIGDLFYNRETGYVYQFKYIDSTYLWEQIIDNNIIQAMALTNASIDTTDNERVVFFDTPTTPYNNGDWYLIDNQLKICQISKPSTEIYEEKRFYYCK